MPQTSICLTPLRVVPGSRLARPAKRADGQQLLAAGSALDREQLTQLFERGIEHVYVEVNDTRAEATIARDVAAVEARAAHLFRGRSGDARDVLHAAILRYRREGAE